jgi:hypothetical protein
MASPPGLEERLGGSAGDGGDVALGGGALDVRLRLEQPDGEAAVSG